MILWEEHMSYNKYVSVTIYKKIYDWHKNSNSIPAEVNQSNGSEQISKS
jgi:hypothetical protein